MRNPFKTAFAGTVLVAAVALAAGARTPAAAGDGQTHTMLVQLPNGAIEQIDYTGDVAPQIVLSPSRVTFAAPDPAFAAFERLSALMDRQADSMLQQVAQMPAWSGTMPNLPSGVSGYSVVTTISGNGACTRSTQVTYLGGNLKPQTVSNHSGNCGAEPDHSSDHSSPAETPVPRQPSEPASRPHTITVKAGGVSPYHRMVREAFYQH